MLAPSTLQQKNRSDYLSVASVSYRIDLELHLQSFASVVY